MTRLDKLYDDYQGEKALQHLAARARFVPGEGQWVSPLVMLVGEAPGRDEDRLGRPFVGASGRLLRSALADAKIPLAECWITNVVKWRPPNNRTPTDEEITAARPYVRSEVAIVSPQVVVPVGRPALEALLPTLGISITSAHGRLVHRRGQPYFPVMHPAFVLRGAYPREDWRKTFRHLRRILG